MSRLLLRRLAERIARNIAELEESGHQIKKLRSYVKVPAGKRLGSSARRRAWMKVAANPASPLLQPEREEILKRYREGKRDVAPRDQEIEGAPNDSQQLSHQPDARREGGDKVEPRSRIDHALIDPDAYEALPEQGKKLANSMVSSPESDRYYSEEVREHRERMRNDHASLPDDERQSIEELRDRRREEFWNRDGYEDYVPTSDSSSSPPENNPDPPEDRRPDPPANNPDPPDNGRPGGGGLGELFGGLGRGRR